ncbi:hypothetical protein Tco_0648504 [Tanacetum coccineum]
MVDLVICISDDSSKESVESPLPMIISPETVMPAAIPPIVPTSPDYVPTSPDCHPSEHSSPSRPPRKRRRLLRCSPSESSDYVSPSPSLSAGPSRKRCRSPVTLVPSSAHTLGALSLTPADLLLSSQKGSYIEVDTTEDTAVAAEDESEDERDDEVEDDSKSNARGTVKIRVDVVAETVVPDDIPVTTMDESDREIFEIRLDVVIQELYDHIVERERADSIQSCLGYVHDELRQICSSRYYNKMDFRRLETFATRGLGYRP